MDEEEMLSHLSLSSFKSDRSKVAAALAVLKKEFRTGQHFKLEDVMRLLNVKSAQRKWLRTLMGKLVKKGYLYRPSTKKYAKVYESLSSWLAVAQAKIHKIESG